MSKKEMEDKYLTLLEQHLQLKSDLNYSEERLKLLSTQLQRISNQHKSENSCTCNYSGKVTHTLKDVIARQKYKIEDLEMKNLGLLERIRILKMNLSTQRQFLGTTGSMKRFQSVSAVGSLGTGRKPQSHRSVQSIKRSEKILSPSSSTKSSSVRDQLEIAIELNETVDIRSSKMSQGIQTSDEDRQTQINVAEELHQRISDLEKELKNAQMKYNEKLLWLEEEQKSLVLERDAAVSSVKRSSQQQLEQAHCWNRVTTEQLREILPRNSELIIQLSMERKKVSELELKLKECVYTTQLVDLVYDQLKHNKYICRVCKTLEQVVERNGLEATSRADFDKDLDVIESVHDDHNPNTAVDKLNAIINSEVAADYTHNTILHNDEKLMTSEVPDRDQGDEENGSLESRIPLSLPVNPEESIMRQDTSLIVTPPLTSSLAHSEDDADVVFGYKRESDATEDMAEVDPQTDTHPEQFKAVVHKLKTEDETPCRCSSSEESQRTKSISQGTYTVQKPVENGYNIYKCDSMNKTKPENVPCNVSEEAGESPPWVRGHVQCEAGQDWSSIDDTCSVSDSSHSAVLLSEGERPVSDDSTTSRGDSSHIESSGWSQQFKSSNRIQNCPDMNPGELCMRDRAERVLSAVSEVLTECLHLQGKARMMTAEADTLN